MFDQVITFVKKIIKTAFSMVCFFTYFSGLYHLISFVERNKPAILMYHSINSRSCAYVYPDNIVSVQNFGKQIDYLFHNKKIISLSELAEMIQSGAKYPPDSVVITFDDGYYDFYSIAYPILKQYRIPSTSFPITNTLDTGEAKLEDRLAYLINTTSVKFFTIHVNNIPTVYDISSNHLRLDCIRKLNSIFLRIKEDEKHNILSEVESQLNPSAEAVEKTTLTWEDIAMLDKSGLVSFGCHTQSHCNLASVDPTTAELEISQSKEKMQRFLGRPCVYFSYPFGRRRDFNRDIEAMLSNEGLLLAVSTIPGRISKGSNPLELKRIQVPDDASYKFKCSLIGITLQRP